MQTFLDAIRAAIAAETGLEDPKLGRPRDPRHGDSAFPCFEYAKGKGEPPPEVAAELETALNARLEGITAKAAGPFLNFTVDRARLAETILGEIAAGAACYGTSSEGEEYDRRRLLLAEHRQADVGRSPALHGDRRLVQRLHDALGFRTVGVNHIGDWGSQFGKLVAAVNRYGDTVDLEGDPIPSLLALYVRYHEEEESDPALVEEAREAFRELESGVDGPVRQTWKKLTELSLVEFQKIYDRLGVGFDLVRGEAFYEPYLDSAVDRVVEAGVTEESDGALVVDLSSFDEIPPCLLRKTDGTTLYATRDLAAVFHRQEEFAFDRCLDVVGADQRLHFRQLKHVLDRMGLDRSNASNTWTSG